MYNKYIGIILHVASVFSFLYCFAVILPTVISIWIQNVWMIPIFLFGVFSIPYVGYCVRSYGEVAWKLLVFNFTKNKYQGVFEEHVYQSVVLPSDCDVFNHMNNSRYSREADFARVRFYVDTGLLDFFHKGLGKYWIMTANFVRYRRSLEVFQNFCLTTQIVYWDDKNIYLQHKFVTSTHDSDFINAVIMSQMRVLDKTGVDHFLCKFLNTSEPPPKPEETDELRHFLNYIESSRNNLRKDL